jgi:hypothetical protein
MPRADAIGFFWQDIAKVKPPKVEKPKRDPPPRFWEAPDYLPGLEAARNFKPDLYNDMELWQAQQSAEPLLFDVEVYPNYSLIGFKGLHSSKVVIFETDDNGYFNELTDIPKLRWILHNFCIINFNGLKYDFPVTTLPLAGYSSFEMWDATDMIIGQRMQAKEVYKKYGTTKLNLNQIDLIELTALRPGLKVCAGRLHAPRLQDLPFKPGTILSADQKLIVRRYWVNDLDNTRILYESLTEQIHLRESQGSKYGLDLRSHSDAQMAEAIIGSEIRKATGQKHIRRTEVDPDARLKYNIPRHVKFQTPLLNWVLDIIRDAVFTINPKDGSVVMPTVLADLVIKMGESKYKIGIGGLHSQEKSIAHVTDDEFLVIDTDATSYYPFTILNAGLVPENLGHMFLIVYAKVVNERVGAKLSGDKVLAEVLKIVANGTFGKLGSMWSIMYAPHLMLQVTLTGQLSILMLAERFELNGIQVTSINTDGIVVKCRRSLEPLFHAIVKQWEVDTGYSTEETRYKATYSKDINNYIAVYETPQKGEIFKTKGLYAKTSSKKNAVNEVCITALKALLEKGTPVPETIHACKDVRMFTTMRFVDGGAVKMGTNGEPDQYLGKLVRWYYATGAEGEIISSLSGNKVARSDNAKPLMDLPEAFPTDINYDWYIEETYKILQNIGHTPKPPKESKKK